MDSIIFVDNCNRNKPQLDQQRDCYRDNNLFGFPQEYIEISDDSSTNNNSQVQTRKEKKTHMDQTARFGFNLDHKPKPTFNPITFKKTSHMKTRSNQFSVPLILKKTASEENNRKQHTYTMNPVKVNSFNPVKIKKSNSYQIQQPEINNHFHSQQLNDNFVNNYNVCVNILNQYGISNSDEIKYDILNFNQNGEKTRLNYCFSANPILRHPDLNSMGQLNNDLRNKIGFTNNYNVPTRHQNSKLQKYQKLPSLNEEIKHHHQRDKSKNLFKSQQKMVEKVFGTKPIE